MWKGTKCLLNHALSQLRYLLSRPDLVGAQGEVPFRQRAWFFKM